MYSSGITGAFGVCLIHFGLRRREMDYSRLGMYLVVLSILQFWLPAAAQVRQGFLAFVSGAGFAIAGISRMNRFLKSY